VYATNRGSGLLEVYILEGSRNSTIGADGWDEVVIEFSVHGIGDVNSDDESTLTPWMSDNLGGVCWVSDNI